MYFPRDLILMWTLGEGSFGRVLKVWVRNHLGLQKHCALKLIRKEILEDKDYVASLFNEIQIYNEINGCIFFPRLHSTFYAVDRLCILTDFCDGGELLALIHRLNGLSAEQIQFYASEIILALKTLHDRDILYRDLKSENILLTKEGHIQMIDFGLSVKTDKLIKGRVGTTECMAPEVLTEKYYGKSADYWSLGILIYEMFFKETPFSDDSVDKIESNILKREINLERMEDKNLSDLIYQLLIKDPRKRLGSQNGLVDIMRHPFFSGVNWEGIRNFRCEPPIDCTMLSKGENYPHYRESVFSLMRF